VAVRNGKIPSRVYEKSDASDTPALALAPVLRTTQFQRRARNLRTDTSDTVFLGIGAY
jgi:hypothetical protein